MENEIDFVDPNTILQNHATPIEDIFQNDSTIKIYKTITGEALRVVFEGIPTRILNNIETEVF